MQRLTNSLNDIKHGKFSQAIDELSTSTHKAERYRPTASEPCIVKGMAYDISGVRKVTIKHPTSIFDAPRICYVSLLRERIEIRKKSGKLIKILYLREVDHVSDLPVYPITNAFKIVFKRTADLNDLSHSPRESSSGISKTLHKFHYATHHNHHSVVLAALNSQQKSIWLRYIKWCIKKLNKPQKSPRREDSEERESNSTKNYKKTNSLLSMAEWMKDPFFENTPTSVKKIDFKKERRQKQINNMKTKVQDIKQESSGYESEEKETEDKSEKTSSTSSEEQEVIHLPDISRNDEPTVHYVERTRRRSWGDNPFHKVDYFL